MSDRSVDRQLDRLETASFVLAALAGLAAAVLLVGLGPLFSRLGASVGFPEAAMLSVSFASVLAYFALCVTAGLGIRRRASWGRTLGLAAAFVSLLVVPVGTVYGLYGLSVWTRADVRDRFACEPADPA